MICCTPEIFGGCDTHHYTIRYSRFGCYAYCSVGVNQLFKAHFKIALISSALSVATNASAHESLASYPQTWADRVPSLAGQFRSRAKL